MAIRTRGFKELNAKLKRLEKSVGGDAKHMTKIGARASLLVVDRTLKGRDSTGAKGKRFARYSKGYLKKRAKAGRQARVNLSFTGNLLSSITHRARKGKVILFFRKAEENLKAHGLHFGNPKHNVPPRPFFGLTRDEGRKIKRMVAENVKEAIK